MAITTNHTINTTIKANVDAMLHTPQKSEPSRENQIR